MPKSPCGTQFTLLLSSRQIPSVKALSRLSSAMSNSELATSYASLILADEGIEITAEKINALVAAAKIDVEPIWATLLAKALEGKNVVDMLSNVGAGGSAPAASSAPAAAAAGGDAPAAEKAVEKVEEKEESDDDMGFGLFD